MPCSPDRGRARSCSASTGPPHRCGGMGSAMAKAERESHASTGPPHRCGGMPRTARREGRRSRSFNGAAASLRRNEVSENRQQFQRYAARPASATQFPRADTRRRPSETRDQTKFHVTIKDLAACEHRRTSSWRDTARGERRTIRRPLADSAHNTLAQAQKSTCSRDHPRGRRRRTGLGLARNG